jgi:hypothetical protein
VIEKDGLVFDVLPRLSAYSDPQQPPVKIKGPATITLRNQNTMGAIPVPMILTIEIVPDAMPPDKTVVVP